MLHELNTNDLVTYIVETRVVKEGDETALYKFQRDRQRLRNWLVALLKENDVIIFYNDEDTGLEKFVIATTVGYDESLIEIPTITETFGDETCEVHHHLPFVSVPDGTPYYIHVNDITRFILKNDKVYEISKKTRLF
jgi:hypothetical protein